MLSKILDACIIGSSAILIICILISAAAGIISELRMAIP